jgi:hypothetical protein
MSEQRIVDEQQRENLKRAAALIRAELLVHLQVCSYQINNTKPNRYTDDELAAVFKRNKYLNKQAKALKKTIAVLDKYFLSDSGE